MSRRKAISLQRQRLEALLLHYEQMPEFPVRAQGMVFLAATLSDFAQRLEALERVPLVRELTQEST